MQSGVIEHGLCDNLHHGERLGSVDLPFINLRDVFCEGVKFRNHKLSLERLHDDHYAWLYHPAKENNS